MGSSSLLCCILNAELENTEFRAAGSVVWEIGQRLDTNSSRWEQCKEYMLYVKDLVQWTVEACKLPQHPLHRIQVRMVPGISVAFGSIIPG